MRRFGAIRSGFVILARPQLRRSLSGANLQRTYFLGPQFLVVAKAYCREVPSDCTTVIFLKSLEEETVSG
jgi:hypothetical protein